MNSNERGFHHRHQLLIISTGQPTRVW